ncbi:hypothetical protein EZV62_015511 [Acer yangbiense]|uniref:FBD domain-containing protein n=1 Tax=Acer yangbiense TaxID=1000413 RepID=A0A5C7HMT1_9ROSI|nr:hypothetical protein EZV62_015511 [Acer yangbiense]
MQKFRLSMTLLDVEEDTSLLDKWIELAVANEVKEFDFNVKMNRDKIYSLPGTILSAKFMTTLKLGGCNMELSSKTIRLHSLRKLSLDKVRIDEQLVQKFISEFPLLEDLFLSPGWHSKHFCISHAPKPKILTIDASSNFCYVQNIEIIAPSLQQCIIIFVKAACVIDMAGCSDLKYLNLTDVYILDQDFHNLISKFPLLEKLIVRKCAFLERLTLSSNRLKELQVFFV